LVSNLVDTLRGIHRLEWTHLDLRLSNVVIYEPRGALRRWYLIDSEYATKIGDPVPKKRYTGHYAGQKAEAVHDFAQLRGMMSFLLTSEQINDRFLEILEEDDRNKLERLCSAAETHKAQSRKARKANKSNQKPKEEVVIRRMNQMSLNRKSKKSQPKNDQVSSNLSVFDFNPDEEATYV
jgi:hypothetical protein